MLVTTSGCWRLITHSMRVREALGWVNQRLTSDFKFVEDVEEVVFIRICFPRRYICCSQYENYELEVAPRPYLRPPGHQPLLKLRGYVRGCTSMLLDIHVQDTGQFIAGMRYTEKNRHGISCPA